MEKTLLTREFVLEKGTAKTTLPDPDPEMGAGEVLKFYSRTYPELVTSSVVGPEYKENKVVWTFKSCVGTKG